MLTFKGEVRATGLAELKRLIEHKVLVGVLNATEGNVPKAAKLLDISRVALYRKMNQQGIELGTGKN